MSFNPKAVSFDGVSDYLIREIDLSGNANIKTGTISSWLRIEGSDGLRQFVFSNTGTRFYCERRGGGNLRVSGLTSGAVLTLQIDSLVTKSSASEWFHLLASWNVSSGLEHFYIDDAETLDSKKNNDNEIDWTRNEWSVGAITTGVLPWNGSISELYLSHEYIDLSVEANRRKFFSATGEPVPLGERGATPTGTKPLIYMSNDYPGLNLGTGGHFDVVGSPQVVEGPNPVIATPSGFDPALLEFFPDTIGIEPYDTMTAQQVFSYGASVSYQSQITGMSERVIAPDGREVTSTSRVVIPQRVFIDPRSRLTLPEGFIPRTPPILGVRPVGGALGLDHTEILL